MDFSLKKTIAILTKTLKYGLIVVLSLLAAYSLFLIYNASHLPELQPWHLRDTMDDTIARSSYPNFDAFLQA